MASKLNISPPRTRAVGPPPEALKSGRTGGRHETLWRSAITLERQVSDPNPLGAQIDGGNFRMDASPGAVRRALRRRQP